MEVWETIWTYVLVGVVVVYFCVTVGVTFGGFRDVQAMFTAIDTRHKSDTEHQSDEQPSNEDTP